MDSTTRATREKKKDRTLKTRIERRSNTTRLKKCSSLLKVLPLSRPIPLKLKKRAADRIRP